MGMESAWELKVSLRKMWTMEFVDVWIYSWSTTGSSSGIIKQVMLPLTYNLDIDLTQVLQFVEGSIFHVT